MSKSSDLKARKSAAVPNGVGTKGIYVAKAENSEIWDVDGRRFIDFAAGIAVVNTGHRHPKVMAAVAAQAQAFFCQGRLSQRGVERAAGAAGQFQQCPGLPHHGRTGGCGAFTRHAGLVPAAGGIIPHHGQQTPAGLRGIAVSRPAPLVSLWMLVLPASDSVMFMPGPLAFGLNIDCANVVTSGAFR